MRIISCLKTKLQWIETHFRHGGIQGPFIIIRTVLLLLLLLFLLPFYYTTRSVDVFEHPHLIKGIFRISIRTPPVFLRKGSTAQGGCQLRQTPMRPRNHHEFATRVARLHLLKNVRGQQVVLSFFEIRVYGNAQFECRRCQRFDLTVIIMSSSSIRRKGVEKTGIGPRFIIKQVSTHKVGSFQSHQTAVLIVRFAHHEGSVLFTVSHEQDCRFTTRCKKNGGSISLRIQPQLFGSATTFFGIPNNDNTDNDCSQENGGEYTQHQWRNGGFAATGWTAGWWRRRKCFHHVAIVVENESVRFQWHAVIQSCVLSV
mmetsp:Transcript_25648/g.46331  ORF Transcript_25648/g.46331 Transcript_25648/m.46331 type:complete len:313 (+) Transcript_25648:198-1136(+)